MNTYVLRFPQRANTLLQIRIIINNIIDVFRMETHFYT